MKITSDQAAALDDLAMRLRVCKIIPGEPILHLIDREIQKIKNNGLIEDQMFASFNKGVSGD